MSSTHYILAATVVSLVAAQVPYLGNCPQNVAPMVDFNMTKFIGRWYEAERYFRIAQFGEKCVSLDYIPEDYGGIKVLSRSKSVLSGANSVLEIRTKLRHNTSDAEMYLAYNTFFLYPLIYMPNWIIDTDYDNYAVVWSCSDMGFLSIRNAWILTKERHPSIGTMEKAYSALDASGISRAYFFRTDQNNCIGLDNDESPSTSETISNSTSADYDPSNITSNSIPK